MRDGVGKRERERGGKASATTIGNAKKTRKEKKDSDKQTSVNLIQFSISQRAIQF